MASLPPADVRGFPLPPDSLPGARQPAAGTRYELEVARDASARLATGWLALGIAALVGSGVFSLLLVLARTPGLKDLFPVANFFQVALVAHVDLSVLVWFVAFAGVLWSLAGDSGARGLGKAALALCPAGTAALTVAPLAGNAVPVLPSYIPVIDNAVTTCVFTNQMREKVGVVFGNPEATPGGKALKVYASVRIDIRRKGTIKDAAGNAIGNHVKVKIVKNKVAPPFAEAEFDILYNHGINEEGSILDVGLESGVVDKKGAWLQFNGELIGQGKEAAQKALVEKPEIAAKIVEAIMAKRSAQTP